MRRKRNWLDWVIFVVATVCIVIGLCMLLGCLGGGGAGCARDAAASAGKKVTGPPLGDANFGILDWAAGICILAGIAALIASTIVPLVPRKSAVMAVLCGIGCWLLKAILARFLGPLAWGAIAIGAVCGISAAWPYILTLKNWSLRRNAKKLAKAGDARAAVALEVQSSPRKFKTKEARKARVAELENHVN